MAIVKDPQVTLKIASGRVTASSQSTSLEATVPRQEVVGCDTPRAGQGQASGRGFELGAAQERRERGHELGGRVTAASHLRRPEPALSAPLPSMQARRRASGAGVLARRALSCPFLSLTPAPSLPRARVGRNKTPILFTSVQKPANKEPGAPRGAWAWTLGAGTAQVPDSPFRAQRGRAPEGQLGMAGLVGCAAKAPSHRKRPAARPRTRRGLRLL